MAFTLPQFINNLDIWVNPATPAGGGPNYTNQPCQIYTWSKQANFWLDSTTGKEVPIIIIRLPPAPSNVPKPGDILGKAGGVAPDDLFYLALFYQRMHSGFPNAYLAYYTVKCRANGQVFVQPRP